MWTRVTISRAIYDDLTRSRLYDGALPATQDPPAFLEPQQFDRFPICTGALLTRYAGDKFERSQHAYRTQRTQIHIQVYALRERRNDPAPKTHTPRHTLLLTTLLH